MNQTLRFRRNDSGKTNNNFNNIIIIIYSLILRIFTKAQYVYLVCTTQVNSSFRAR